MDDPAPSGLEFAATVSIPLDPAALGSDPSARGARVSVRTWLMQRVFVGTDAVSSDGVAPRWLRVT